MITIPTRDFLFSRWENLAGCNFQRFVDIYLVRLSPSLSSGKVVILRKTRGRSDISAGVLFSSGGFPVGKSSNYCSGTLCLDFIIGSGSVILGLFVMGWSGGYDMLDVCASEPDFAVTLGRCR